MRVSSKEFYEKTGLKVDGEYIIALKDLKEIKKIEVMKESFLERILRNVRLKDGRYAYRNAEIMNVRISPSKLYVGQTFLQKDKIIRILSLPRFFKQYGLEILGVSKVPPLIVYGKEGEVSFYVPPIAEIKEREGIMVIIDGIHRSYVCMGAGTTCHYILIKSSVELPFTPERWEKIRIVEEKPLLKERYFNFEEDFFRVLKEVGIDG